MSIVITTPTGNIGSRALQQLLKAGAEVACIVRQPEKLSESIRSRIKVHQGSLSDAALVSKAFQGARAVLWVTPSDFAVPDVAAYHREMGAIAASAIRENNVPYVVNISSVGAQLENAGPVSGVGNVERLLNEVAENAIHLRPGFFMENFLLELESIKRDGTVHYPFPGDRAFPMIATRDIGDSAAELLLKTDWSGSQIRGLHGPADMTFANAAKILGDSIGKTVKHVQISPDQAYQAILGLGASSGFAKAYVELHQALAQPCAVAELRTRGTTTPTTLREWSDTVLRPLLASE
jgi:uncharacterized protein YbjT (DUF2867 family)